MFLLEGINPRYGKRMSAVLFAVFFFACGTAEDEDTDRDTNESSDSKGAEDDTDESSDAEGTDANTDPADTDDAEGNLIQNGGFDDGLFAWWVDEFVAEVSTGGGLFCAKVAPGDKPAEGMLGQSNIDIEAGVSYTFSFFVSGDPVSARVVLNDPATTMQIGFDFVPEEEGRTISIDFAVMVALENIEVIFLLGGAERERNICIDNVALVPSGAKSYVPETGPRVRINQVGYLPNGPKFATLVTDEISPLPFSLLDKEGAEVFSGESVPFGTDASSKLDMHTLDFSDYRTEGGGYEIAADGETSYPFSIGATLYDSLRRDALDFFYLQRSGIAVDTAAAGDYARPAGHDAAPDDGAVNKGDRDIPCLAPETAEALYGEPWQCDYTLDATGGWYDAGNYAKVVVTGGISVWTLLNLYERTLTAPAVDPDALGDDTLMLPEAGNGVPDVLDEARWELEFFLKMVVPEGYPYAGMVHLKVDETDPVMKPVMPDEDPSPRFLFRPSTAATLNLAAVAAQGARLFAPYDPAFADELLIAARAAWDAAEATPDLPAADTEVYSDEDLQDEFYWAAAELYLTTGENVFLDFVESAEIHGASWVFTPWGFTWAYLGVPAFLDLATVPSALPDRDIIVATFLEGARQYLDDQAENGFGQPYVLPDGGYVPVSNSQILNNLMTLAFAYDLSGDSVFLDGMLKGIDYIFGRNALNISYVKDYGTKTATNLFAYWYAHSFDSSMQPAPPGAIAGGPTTTVDYWDAYLKSLYPNEDCAPQFCYADNLQAYSVNEISITMNSSLAWLAAFIADQAHGAASLKSPTRKIPHP